MSAGLSWNQRNTGGHRPPLQLIPPLKPKKLGVCPRITSEIHAQAEHDDPGIVGLGDSAEIRAVDIRIWVVELRGIEHIDEISAHLQLLVLPNADVLDQIGVK